MKKSIFLLGVMVILASNVSFSAELTFEQQSEDLVTSQDQSSQTIYQPKLIAKPKVKLEAINKLKDITVEISSNYQAKVEDKIVEDKKVTECPEVEFYILYFNNEIQNVIKDNNQIIESTTPDEAYPLDYELMNKASIQPKSKDEKSEKPKPLIF
jgi:hypothetical protein